MVSQALGTNSENFKSRNFIDYPPFWVAFPGFEAPFLNAFSCLATPQLPLSGVFCPLQIVQNDERADFVNGRTGRRRPDSPAYVQRRRFHHVVQHASSHTSCTRPANSNHLLAHFIFSHLWKRQAMKCFRVISGMIKIFV